MKKISYCSLMSFLLIFLYGCNPLETQPENAIIGTSGAVSSTANMCHLSDDCLNTHIYQYFEETCSECSQEHLSQFINHDVDQIIFLRKFQFDLSKQCGNLQLSKKQIKLFTEDCDYMLFSSQGQLQSYIKGSCFTPSKSEKLEKPIRMFDVSEKSLLNSNISPDTDLIIHNNGIKYIKIDSSKTSTEPEFKCFTSFKHQSP